MHAVVVVRHRRRVAMELASLVTPIKLLAFALAVFTSLVVFVALTMLSALYTAFPPSSFNTDRGGGPRPDAGGTTSSVANNCYSIKLRVMSPPLL